MINPSSRWLIENPEGDDSAHDERRAGDDAPEEGLTHQGLQPRRING